MRPGVVLASQDSLRPMHCNIHRREGDRRANFYAQGSSTFVIGASEDADIRLGTDVAMSRRMPINRRHFLVEFDEWAQVVVRDVAKRSSPGTVSYENDHHPHKTIGNPEHPPTWVIPPGRKVTFSHGPLQLEFVVPDHQRHLHQYLDGIQIFRASRNNSVSMMSGPGLGNQTLTAGSQRVLQNMKSHYPVSRKNPTPGLLASDLGEGRTVKSSRCSIA